MSEGNITVRNSLQQVGMWTAVSVVLILEYLTNGIIMRSILPKLVPRQLIFPTELFALLVSILNLVYCVYVCLSEFVQHMQSQKKPGKVTDSPSLDATPISVRHAVRVNTLTSVSAFLDNFFKYVLTAPKEKTFRNPNLSYAIVSDSDTSKNTSMSSMVGYHDSPANKSVSSIYTRSQLEEILSEENRDTVVDATNCAPFFSYNFDEGYYKAGTPYFPSEKTDTAFNQVKSFMSGKDVSREAKTERNSHGVKPGGAKSSRKQPGYEFVPVVETDLLKVLKWYNVLPADVEMLELKLRIWLCNTILRPLCDKIDELNGLFVEKFSGLHLRIGTSSLDALKSGLSHKQELCTDTALPFVLPYLRLCHNQSYIAQRIRDLAESIAIEEFKWNSGGAEVVREEKNEFSRLSVWNDQLPTDSELLINMFCTYMNFHLLPSPSALNSETSGDGLQPFSSVYFVKSTSNTPPTSIRENPEAFCIQMVSAQPPTFQLVTDGGETIILPYKETQHNFWLVLMLFLAHVKKHNRSRIGHLHLTSLSLDIFDL